MRPQPSPGDIRNEENLLIEAISLLVQRQRETEAWLSDQIVQAGERTAATDRRYAELESRLAGIEAQLQRLVPALEPSASGEPDERLARLREQVEGLRSGNDVRTARGQPPPRLPPPEAPRETSQQASRVPSPETARGPHADQVAPGQGSTLSDLLGRTPADRFGSFLIAIGALAVVYAVLSQFALR